MMRFSLFESRIGCLATKNMSCQECFLATSIVLMLLDLFSSALMILESLNLLSRYEFYHLLLPIQLNFIIVDYD